MSQHPNPAVAAKWRYWAACIAILVPVAPYEILAIFPTNDRISEIGARLEAKGGGSTDEEGEEELRGLMKKWAMRNLGRVVLPLAASVVGLWSVVGGQSL